MDASSSHHDGIDHSDEAMNAGPPPPSILIQRQPPSAVFLEETFESEIVVEGMGVAAGSTFDVLASLEEDEPYNRGIARLVVIHDPSPLLVDTPGVMSFTISSESERQLVFQRNHVYRIRVSVLYTAPNAESPHGAMVVASTVTTPILVVLHKIQVSPIPEWSNIWYKDEGGRDKAMEVLAGIYDHQRTLLYEPVPLLLTLCYGSNGTRCFPPIPVANQEILRILAPKTKSNQLVMDDTTGVIKIRFRVEDVSKNHQGQDFCLQVAVDSNMDAASGTIAPGYTPLVTIRSKRNKRGRHSSAVTTVAAASAAASLLPMTESSSTHLNTTIQPAPSSSSATIREHSALVSSNDASAGRPSGPLQSAQIRDAVHGIARWVDEVVTGLYPLQWQVMGYSPDAHGNPDYNRPYHNMHNPNALINRVLSTYNDSTRHQLELLQQVVDGSGGVAAENLPRQHAPYPPLLVPSLPMLNPSHFGSLPPRFNLPPHREYGHALGMFAPSLPEMLADNVPPRPPYYNHPQQQQQMIPSVSRVNREARAALPSSSARTIQGSGTTWRSPPPAASAKASLVDSNSTVALVRSLKDNQESDTVLKSPPVAGPLPAAALSVEDTAELESKVEYIIAQEFKSVRTRTVLGLPAYDADKVLVGFYLRTGECGPFYFRTVDPDDFGPSEMQEATSFVEQALVSSKPPVKSRRELGSIQSMLDHVLVYEFQKSFETEADRSTKGEKPAERCTEQDHDATLDKTP